MEIEIEKPHTVEAYFAQPKKDRVKWGFWYVTPPYLPCDFLGDKELGWDAWGKQMAKEFPVQYFIRNSWNNLESEFRYWKGKFRDWWIWAFEPQHSELRAAIPRNWRDLSELMVEINFAVIKSFYKEAAASCIDWTSEPKTDEFSNWLTNSYNYITIRRPALEKEMFDSYPKGDERKQPYEVAYKKVNDLEREIESTDTKILKEMIDYRGYFWT